MKIEGKISKIFYHNPRSYFTSMAIVQGFESISCSGSFPILYPKASVVLYGNYKMHKKYGNQFIAESYDLKEPSTSFEMIDFLGCEAVGCDPYIASRIASKIGLEYLNIHKKIDELMKDFLDVTNMPQDDIRKVLERTSGAIDLFQLRKKLLKGLSEMGFAPEIASRIAFSGVPIDLDEVKRNPYTLIKPFDLTWELVDKIALNNGMRKDSQVRIEEALCFLLDYATEKNAHMFVTSGSLRKVSQKFLQIEFDFDYHLSHLEHDHRIMKDIKDRIYSTENYVSERLLAENLYRIHKGTPPQVPADAIQFEEGEFAKDQEDAIRLMLSSPLSIVSGAAGTGKTTILTKTIKTLEQNGFQIQLCAPTGRAAKRMKEVTNIQAKTIHHLLQFDRFTKAPQFTKREPLEKNCYIVDEVSMADIKLMSHLFEAIPNNSKVILVGDVNQLPSIGPGKFLKDLLTYEAFPSKVLTEIFRQKEGSCLLDVATKIREGEQFELDDLPKNSDFRFLNLHEPSQIKQSIRQLLERFAQTNYDPFDDLQIITPIHKGSLGTMELNSYVQDILNPCQGNDLTYGNRLFRKHDKVIQTKNNYDKKIFNGDIGRIISLDAKSRYLLVKFDDETVEYNQEEIFELELAYVLTVHKVQGGEYPFIIMPYHGNFGRFMLNRKSLYTALTRAKTQAIFLGQWSAFQKSIATEQVSLRNCNLLGRLQEARLKNIFQSQ